MCLIQHAKEGSLRNQNLRGFDPQRLKNTVAFTCQELLCAGAVFFGVQQEQRRRRVPVRTAGAGILTNIRPPAPSREAPPEFPKNEALGLGLHHFPPKAKQLGIVPPRADCCQPIKSGFQQGPGGWKMPLQALGGQVMSRVQHHSRFQ